jgi:pimeloyl-ACP methyl ester carboxylesterase|tara:strand:- start:51 stop:413 length:363 start_codon:yes stop_codon:yes gene_type:complete
VVLPRFILGSSLKGTNAEIMLIRAQLIATEPRWKGITIPVLIVKGDEALLVVPCNADFMERMLVNSDATCLQLEGMGHFVLSEESELIRIRLLIYSTTKNFNIGKKYFLDKQKYNHLNQE